MANIKECYSYHPVTFEFTGVTEADESPLEPGEWHYPANTTEVEPPDSEDGKALVWGGPLKRWSHVPDHRGETWWLGDVPYLITSLGDPSKSDPPLSADPPPTPEMKPTIISDRQFFQQLAMDGVITEDEALATSDGTMPQLLMDTIAMLPQEQQFGAKMLAKNATQFERNNPLVAIIGQRLGWDDDRLDRLWSEASKL